MCNSAAASALLETALSQHQHYWRQREVGISADGDSAKSYLQRQREVSISAVSDSADAVLALSPTALVPT
jgi:hypothetical protein